MLDPDVLFERQRRFGLNGTYIHELDVQIKIKIQNSTPNPTPTPIAIAIPASCKLRGGG
jgi:hypothetical protein